MTNEPGSLRECSGFRELWRQSLETFQSISWYILAKKPNLYEVRQCFDGSRSIKYRYHFCPRIILFFSKFFDQTLLFTDTLWPTKTRSLGLFYIYISSYLLFLYCSAHMRHQFGPNQKRNLQLNIKTFSKTLYCILVSNS